MSVVYEHRNFIHDGSYPPIGDHDHDHNGHDRNSFPPPDMTDLTYSLASTLGHDNQGMMGDSISDMVTDAQLSMATSAAIAALPAELADPLPSNAHHEAHLEGHHEDHESPAPSGRSKCIPKPEREVHKQADGKFYCTFAGCNEDIQVFNRKCEWSKHMDKHERPYRCLAEGCEKLPGFTYSGGLLRHEREVHGKHGGPKNTVNCPHPNCKRHTGKGFSRQENLNEHLRRVHTGDVSTPAADDVISSDGDLDMDRVGAKRKRSRKDSSSDVGDLLEEVKRVRLENEELREQLDRQSQHSLAMMAQIAELQEALRVSGLDPANLTVDTSGMSAPTAAMM